MLTTSSHDDPAGEARAVTRLLQRGVDGMVIAPCSPRIALPPSGGRRSCAVVMTDRAFPGQPYPVVVTDNEAAGRRLAGILLAERGDAVFLAASRRLSSIEERIRGFLSACSTYGLDDAEDCVFSSESDDVAAGRRLMEQAIANWGGLPGAFVCSSLLEFLPNRVVSARQDEKAIARTIFRCLTGQLKNRPVHAERLMVEGHMWSNGHLGER